MHAQPAGMVRNILIPRRFLGTVPQVLSQRYRAAQVWDVWAAQTQNNGLVSSLFDEVEHLHTVNTRMRVKVFRHTQESKDDDGKPAWPQRQCWTHTASAQRSAHFSALPCPATDSLSFCTGARQTVVPSQEHSSMFEKKKKKGQGKKTTITTGLAQCILDYGFSPLFSFTRALSLPVAASPHASPHDAPRVAASAGHHCLLQLQL